MPLAAAKGGCVKKTFLAALLVVAALMCPSHGAANAGWAATHGTVKQDAWSRIALRAGDLTLEDVKFEFPKKVGPVKHKVRTSHVARFTVKNASDKWLRASIAVALFDGDGRLVGVASGGNRFGVVRAGKTTDYTLFFHYVQEHISSASTYHVVLEVDDHK